MARNEVHFYSKPYHEEDGTLRRNFFYQLELGKMIAEADGMVAVSWQREDSPTVRFRPAQEQFDAAHSAWADMTYDDSASVIVHNFASTLSSVENLESNQIVEI